MMEDPREERRKKRKEYEIAAGVREEVL